jgi:thiamine pyrophosphokinase
MEPTTHHQPSRPTSAAPSGAQPPSGVLVIAGGSAPAAGLSGVLGLSGLLAPGVLVVAADSGVDHALAMGMTPDVAIGDFDSVSDAGLATVADAGGLVIAHRSDKDATDLELALGYAAATGTGRIVVVGGTDGRLDHLLAAAVVLTAPDLAGVEVTAHFGRASLFVVRPGRPVTVTGVPGQVVTLLPVGGPATGVRTDGLRFALGGEQLDPWSARAVSNEFVTPTATVAVDGGVLLVVLPGHPLPTGGTP